jgi:molybdenum cofactor synthesis domain-containing protein
MSSGTPAEGFGFDLLDKHELQVVGVELTGADLNDLAGAAAEVLELSRVEVLVTDYLDHVLTFDVLRPTLYPHQLLNRGDALLARLAEIPGVTLAPDATVESRGMLGWIAADGEDLAAALGAAQLQAAEILARIAKRVQIFSTGAELVTGQVKDTNTATITERLGLDGYRCEHGGALGDDAELIAGAIRRAVEDGFGIVVTTGGVGAEAKDCTVEAVLRVDPEAATPYLCHFEVGHGRHAKDGVRIAVGTYQGSLLVALPGPNDEVRSAVEILRAGLRHGTAPAELAGALAADLRGILLARMGHLDANHHQGDHA